MKWYQDKNLKHEKHLLEPETINLHSDALK